jgi:CHAT domain-containing protein
MQRFYRLRQEAPLSKAEALRQAQLGLLEGPDPSHPCTGARGVVLGEAASAKDQTPSSPACRWSHPYYWAPFILMGNWL